MTTITDSEIEEIKGVFRHFDSLKPVFAHIDALAEERKAIVERLEELELASAQGENVRFRLAALLATLRGES